MNGQRTQEAERSNPSAAARTLNTQSCQSSAAKQRKERRTNLRRVARDVPERIEYTPDSPEPKNAGSKCRVLFCSWNGEKWT